MQTEEKKNTLLQKIHEKQVFLVELCSRLVQIPSETPPSDTRAIAQAAAEVFRQIDGAEVTLHTMEDPVTNVVARLKGNGPGKRLVFNGHLDTFPVGDRSAWTVDPFAAIQKDGRLYGRGVSDMKGGIACSMLAFMLMAEHRDAWSGEIVITLAGDEESMGVRGTKYLLDTVPHATGDAMICGDVGSPKVVRFGEKGLLWLELTAVGKSAHGAHVHKGVNAIDRLVEGIFELNKHLKHLPIDAPEMISNAILQAHEGSETYLEQGETDVLQSVTVNFGVIEGGISPNLVPARASAKGDIRLPAGITIAQVEQKIKEIVASIEGLSYNIFRQYEPNWSDVNHEIFSLLAANSRQVMGQSPVVTMRVGASDARLYRLIKNVPAVNCGLTPYNLGGPDEYIDIHELINVAKIHTLTAFDFLATKA
jgi:succinyl-diaminopimelate desuccinylase